MASLSPTPKLQFFDANGNPLAGGKLYTYAAGTTTPLATYTDSTGASSNTNPVILDSRGEASVWLGSASYKFKLDTSVNVTLWTIDNIDAISAASLYVSIANLASTASNTLGDALVGFKQSNSTGFLINAVARTVNTKLQEILSVKDFGAVGDGVTDDTSAIINAVAGSAGKALYFPAGAYVVGQPINVPTNSTLYGDIGQTSLKIKSGTYPASDGDVFVITGVNNVQISGIDIDGNKGNIGSTRNPVHVIFNSQFVTFDRCNFVNCEGIVLNFSTNVDTITVSNCRFIYCGGLPDGTDGYRKQAIAFSGSLTQRSSNIKITSCSFFVIGLDCISLADCSNVVISDNVAENSYTFLFNTPSPSYSENLTISDNSIYNTSQTPLSNTVNPIAIDLPRVYNCTITGNSIYKTDQSGIGIFGDSKNVTIVGNTLVDCGQRTVSWCAGISVGSGDTMASNISDIIIADNNIIDNGVGGVKMNFGILLQNDLTNVFVSCNNIVNSLTSKYGYLLSTAVPSPGTTSPLVDNTPITATTFIEDLDLPSATITNWRKQNTFTGYYFNGVKVVGIQQAAIANSGNATTDAILAALRTHGLIAT